MHFLHYIILPRGTVDFERVIAQLMKPHEGDEWDWYQVGGRWTGELSGYKPEQDPANVEECEQCGGTGFRSDLLGLSQRAEDPTYTCNGCGTWNAETKLWAHGEHGPGRRLKWATQWAGHTGDILPVALLDPSTIDAHIPYSFQTPDGTWIRKETWNGETFTQDPEFKAKFLEALNTYTQSSIAVIDIHN